MLRKRRPKFVLNRLGLFALLSMTNTSLSIAADLQPVSFADLRGWENDNHKEALAAFHRSCIEIINEGKAFNRAVMYGGSREDWLSLCLKKPVKDARSFFETEFIPFLVKDPERPQGLFTGYYEPEAEGSLERSEIYHVPIYAKPPDLVTFDKETENAVGLKYGRVVNGENRPYLTRREIEEGGLAGHDLEIVWLKDWADAFFIHIQGSGRIILTDGSALRLAYAAKSGQPYTAIGGRLVERGILNVKDMSMQAIRSWMKDNPQAARKLMWENHSFVFFQTVELADGKLGAPGAQHVQLTPHRSLAVDRRYWMFGTPVWLEANVPSGDQTAPVPFHHLMIAQDTGTAIKGLSRGDIYWGWGDKAAEAAGHMKNPGRMVVLLPKTVSAKLLPDQ